MSAALAKLLRCAVYTRVSTEYGLEQEFNSLAAQREACEAYITSQKHEGWTLVPTAFDDGGFSGGSMNRPALQQLLAAIDAGEVDIVVVYKVDRLTRSLADFAKLVERFDARQVSFVSVTQSFNTTSSMGRLTLNVLLSFAQFEREVTGERIRDKIAASKKKGLRMGGPVPLGYDTEDKKLVINPAEAETIRFIFRRYLELRSLTGLLRELRERGLTTKISKLRDGTQRGGVPFSKGPLAYLLRNRVYIGDVCHKGQHYSGHHPPIIALEQFEAVQTALSEAAPSSTTRINTNALLVGKLFDDRGFRMTPTTANKGGVRYRYYTSFALQQGRREEAGSVPRVSAPEIEQAVLDLLQEHLSIGSQNPEEVREDPAELISAIARVIVRRNSLEVRYIAATGEAATTSGPWTPTKRKARRQVVGRSGDQRSNRPIRAETRARMLAGIAKARNWLDEILAGRVKGTHEIAEREGCSERSARMTLNLAFLSPEVAKAVVNGSISDGVTVTQLTEAEMDWDEQSELFLCS